MSELRFSPQKEKEEQKNEAVASPAFRRPKKRSWKFLLSLIVLIILASLAKDWYMNRVDDAFYSVVLMNNQMYFGKIEKKSSKELALTNVHYLAPAQSSTTAPQLVRMESQVYKPENSFRVPMNSILFYQPLRPDSQIVQLITSNNQ